MNFSSGIIFRLGEDNFTIEHRCDSSEGSSGAPLINSTNFQVIGIHKGGAKGAKKYNLGTLIKEPIEKFNEEIKTKKKSFIDSIRSNMIINTLKKLVLMY